MAGAAPRGTDMKPLKRKKMTPGERIVARYVGDPWMWGRAVKARLSKAIDRAIRRARPEER
jgi:hypothetical protein